MFTGKFLIPALRRLTMASAAALLIGAAPSVAQGYKPNDFALKAGDAVVTGFSGIRPAEPRNAKASGGDEIMVIDLNAPSMRILRSGRTGKPPLPADVTFEIPAGEIGQVFPIAIGKRGRLGADIYLGATSLFGLQIVLPDSDGDGVPERTRNGHPNADWMQGQFGEGGGPGSIYKVDGDTGEVSLFSEISGNSGPGLGGIVHDARTGQLYVSDLDTGLVHRIDAEGKILGSYDHGRDALGTFGGQPLPDDGRIADIKDTSFDSDDPETWGLTQSARRVWGLALREGRLFYSVSDGTEIWSVGLNPDGSFSTDIRPEIDIEPGKERLPITDMVFGADGSLYAAQRGFMTGGFDYNPFADNSEAKILRFVFDERAAPEAGSPWRLVEPDVTGLLPKPLLLSGGIDLGRCEGGLWSTADASGGETLGREPGQPVIYPLGTPARGVVKASEGEGVTLVSFNNFSAAGTGDVEVFKDCEPVQAAVYVPVHGPATSHWRSASRGPGLVPVHTSAASHNKHGSDGGWHGRVRSHWRYASHDSGHSVRRSHWKWASPGDTHSRLRSHWKWASPGDGHSIRRSHWRRASPGDTHSVQRSHWKKASPGDTHSVQRSHWKKASPGDSHGTARSHMKFASPPKKHGPAVSRLQEPGHGLAASHLKFASPKKEHGRDVSRLREPGHGLAASHLKFASSPKKEHGRDVSRLREPGHGLAASHLKKASPAGQPGGPVHRPSISMRVTSPQGGHSRAVSGVNKPQSDTHTRAISRAVFDKPKEQLRPAGVQPKPVDPRVFQPGPGGLRVNPGVEVKPR
jgi:hypothetical protein